MRKIESYKSAHNRKVLPLLTESNVPNCSARCTDHARIGVFLANWTVYWMFGSLNFVAVRYFVWSTR